MPFAADHKLTNTVMSVKVCSETGKKATTGCPHTYTEYFLWLTAPDLCDKHSGQELKDTENIQQNTNNSLQENITEIVKGITNEIDEEEPQRTDNMTTNNITTPSIKNEENDKDQTTNNTTTDTSHSKENHINNTTTNSSNNNSTTNTTNTNSVIDNTTNQSNSTNTNAGNLEQSIEKQKENQTTE